MVQASSLRFQKSQAPGYVSGFILWVILLFCGLGSRVQCWGFEICRNKGSRLRACAIEFWGIGLRLEASGFAPSGLTDRSLSD